MHMQQLRVAEPAGKACLYHIPDCFLAAGFLSQKLDLHQQLKLAHSWQAAWAVQRESGLTCLLDWTWPCSDLPPPALFSSPCTFLAFSQLCACNCIWFCAAGNKAGARMKHCCSALRLYHSMLQPPYTCIWHCMQIGCHYAATALQPFWFWQWRHQYDHAIPAIRQDWHCRPV